LIEDLGFSSEIQTPTHAKERYILSKGKLSKVPGKFLWMIIPSLLKEWKEPVVHKEETIWEFACRRFGKRVAEQILDPIVLGIYAGDIKKLSLSAAFPRLKQLEEENGSIVKGLLFSKKKKKALNGAPLFFFKKGGGSFIRHLSEKLPYDISYGETAKKITKEGESYLVETGKRTIEADRVVLAIPAYRAAELLEEKTANRLLSIPYQPVTTVSVALKEGVKFPQGFGYLIPKLEKEKILGVLFDSNFSKEEEAKLTVMLDGVDLSDEELKEAVERVLSVHLKIDGKVKTHSSRRIEKAIPQYVLGHKKNIEEIRKSLPEGIHLVGNYLEGVSVSDSIKLAKEEATSIQM
jgi:protoporphyrinogen/coproporphyrinogen III oxidase